MNAEVIASGSIRRRLMTQLLLSAAVLAFIFYLTLQNFALRLADENQDDILGASLTAILDAAAIRNDKITIDIPYSAFSMLGNVSNDRVFYSVYLDGDFLTGYDDLPVLEAERQAETNFETLTYQGESVRVATFVRKLSIEGSPLFLQASIAQTRNGQQQILSRISRSATIFGLSFFALAALLAFVAAQSTIRPLQRLAESVSRRGPSDLRPVTSEVPSEMVPLVRSLNQFIKRLEKSLTRSEDFIAEAAHRVRTPLATVRTQAEITLLRVDKDENRQSLRGMIRAIDESSRAAGQLLDHAMVTFRTDHLEEAPVDLGELITDIAEQLRPLAELKDIEIVLDIQQQATILGDRILLQNAVRNLIDNSIKYSEAEGSVYLSLHVENGKALIQVRDQGSGFPTEDIELLSKRFVRGENTAGVVGSGLGLTIVEEVMQAHNGVLTIANYSESEGACVTLSFPLL